MKKIIHNKKRHFWALTKGFFWFSIGIFLGLFFCISFIFIFFQNKYSNLVYKGVFIDNIEMSGRTKDEVKKFFIQKNENIAQNKLTFTSDYGTATISASQIDFGYNAQLLSEQAYSIGRSEDFISNLSLVFQSYINGVYLEPSYHYSKSKLDHLLKDIVEKIYIEPVDAIFSFENGRVTAFKPSSNGQEVDFEQLNNKITAKIPIIVKTQVLQNTSFSIPIKVLKPKIETDQANSLGIKELIASGTSLYQHSIPNRIFNVNLAASRINGTLIKPGETFSFAKVLGDVSSFTGYKQAYIIQSGKTVLGDGGGVCQVSTTLFRAILNAGLPILERSAHGYRVGYYEQDSPPGFDATVYVPTVDLKFKNDTNHHILIQAEIDSQVQRLTFYLYGTKDNREVIIGKPVVTNRSPAPEPLYQDDPTLPIGQIKQVDFAADGATATFTREVIKDGQKIISEKFVSNYRPWQAIFLRGTKAN